MQRQSRRIARVVCGATLALGLAGAANAAQRPDAWVTTKVKISLLTSEGISTRNVHVDTIDGRVTLHGSVSTPAEKARAEQLASQIEGAREVRNLLQVVPPEREAKTDSTDAQLEMSVQASLKADRALADSSIAVESVNAGVVLLSGKARTLSDSHRAIDLAAAVPGVRRVASQIESPDTLGDDELWREDGSAAASYEKSAAADMWITTAAKLRLIGNRGTPGFDINVDTRDGSVTLFGVVDSAGVKQAAEAEVRKIDGVRNVVNDLQVVAAAQQDRVELSDTELIEAIQARFDANADLGDAKIGVAVSNGVARLTGTVKSRSDQVTALTAARSTAGVVRVIDDLRLEPSVVSTR